MRPFLARAFRPFALLRGFWIGVALLHFLLLVRRLVAGEITTSADQFRLWLCLVGAIYGVYATARLEAASRPWSASPRRVLAFALIVFLGHLAVRPAPEGPLTHADRFPLSPEIPFVVPLFLAGTLLAALAVARARDRVRNQFRRCRPVVMELVSVGSRMGLVTAVRIRPPPPR